MNILSKCGGLVAGQCGDVYKRQVLYYMGEETPMFRFSGVTVTVEWMRGMIGAAILTGAVGALLGTGIAEILEKGRKKSGQYE